MNHRLFYILALVSIICACGSNQRITSTWVNPEAASRGASDSIFILVLAESNEFVFSVEERLAATIASRGQDFVLSSSVLPPKFSTSENFTREQMANVIREKGCDAVFVLALLDVLTVETYHPGTVYYPMNYGMYGSYFDYYYHYYPRIYSPGYYSSDKIYYVETNFYDLEKDQLMWSMQSEAVNPSSLENWFDGYINKLLDVLVDEGLISNEVSN